MSDPLTPGERNLLACLARFQPGPPKPATELDGDAFVHADPQQESPRSVVGGLLFLALFVVLAMVGISIIPEARP